MRFALLLCVALFPWQFSMGQKAALHAPTQRPPYELALANLSDPLKLATLGERQANPRLKKILYWLDEARRAGVPPEKAVEGMLITNGYTSDHGKLIKSSLLRNLSIADASGFFSGANRDLLRRGKAPLYGSGEEAHVDHIIPLRLAPEIGNNLANLQLTPASTNLRKGARIDGRQLPLAWDLHKAGVLKRETFLRIQTESERP